MRVLDVKPSVSGRTAFVAVVGLLALVLGLLFPYFETTRNANERPRLLQAMALVDNGQWAIDGPASRGLKFGPDVAKSEVDGRIYPNKPPGTTLVAAAGYRIARATADARGQPLLLRDYTWWARLLGGVVPTLLLGLWLMRRYMPRYGWQATGAAVVLYALGTPAASYAHLLYGHQLAALCLVVGSGWLVDAVGAKPAVDRRATLGWAAAGGGLAGAAVTVEYGAVFAALPLGVMLLVGVRQPKGVGVLVAGLVGALVPIALLAAYHDAVFGSPWATGYHHVTSAEFAQKHGQGLLGLGLPRWSALYTHVFSADGGLLWWAPTVPLALYGLAQLALAKHPDQTEARVFLGLWVVYLVVIAGLSFEGGWRVGPRYVVAVLPALTLGWAHALSQLRTQPLGMAGLTAVATYAVTINALAANLWPHFDLTNIHQPVAEVLLPLWFSEHQPYGLLQRWGVDALGWVVGGSLVGLWMLLSKLAEPGLRVALAMLAAIALGFGLVGATTLVEAHPMGERNLNYIRRTWEPVEGKAGESVELPTHP